MLESQKKANEKWLSKNYEQVKLSVSKGTKARLKEWAASYPVSMTQFILTACQEKAERDGKVRHYAAVRNSPQIAQYVIDTWDEEKKHAVWNELVKLPKYQEYEYNASLLCIMLIEEGLEKQYGIQAEPSPYTVERGCQPYQTEYQHEADIFYCAKAKFTPYIRKSVRKVAYHARAIKRGDAILKYGEHYFCPLYEIHWEVTAKAPGRIPFGTEVGTLDVNCDWSTPLQIQRCYSIDDAAETCGLVEVTDFLQLD